MAYHHYLQQVFQKQKDIDVNQCSEDPPETCHKLPYFNSRDIYAQQMHSFITSLSSMGIVVSNPKSTYASSTEDNEDVYNMASLGNYTAT